MIDHADGTQTLYAHLSERSVKVGDTVKLGQRIGKSGDSGNVDGPHLHFEFRINGAHKDPLTIARQSEAVPVSSAAKPLFLKQAAAVRQQLTLAATLQPSSVQ
jgi:murein DD-endopeptidase MepM/ murein hydrolase activator NlpD